MSQHLGPLSNKSIFISRKTGSSSPLHKLIEDHQVTLTDIPLIRIVQIPFSHTPKTSWIFFSSKNAIKYFFAQNPELSPDVKYGVIGDSSGKELEAHGKKASFTGEGTDLVKIAKRFREVLQNESVLFPQAMDSMRSIQKQLAFTNTTYNLYTYKTLIRTDFELPYTDILIFTSPSNVTAYFTKYTIDARQVVVAIGNSTRYKLADHGIKDVLLPEEFSEKGLYDVLMRVYSA